MVSTLTIMDEIKEKETLESRGDVNHASSIHVIDEEDDSEECTNEYSDRNIEKEDKNVLDDESAYVGESFCSDDSSEASEISNGSPRSSIGESIAPYHSCNFQLRDDEEKNEEETQDVQPSYNVHEGKRICWSQTDVQAFSKNNKKFQTPKHIRAKRKNMSFTDYEMRKIERENELLLRKIMAQQKPRNKLNYDGISQYPQASSSAINRRTLQRKIEGDNMLLLRRIQDAKPCVMSSAMTRGYRFTLL